MQAILTKYLGPTNSRGSRVKAHAQSGSIIINWDHGLSNEDNHLLAAKALMNKYEWHKHSAIKDYGHLPGGAGLAVILCLKAKQ